MAQGREPATNTQVFQILPSVIGVRDNWYLLWDFDRLSDYFAKTSSAFSLNNMGKPDITC
jgi:hypothetical protein